MLSLGQSLLGKGVLSLRTGRPVAEVLDVIINPNNLKIEGWYVQDSASKEKLILLSQDVRDIIPQGLVVNDEGALTPAGELVRLQKVLELRFELLGKPVITQHKRRVGKVSDYAFEKNDAFIQKLYVAQPLIKSFGGGELTIDRTQVIEITHRKIVVNEATERTDEVALPAAVPAQ